MVSGQQCQQGQALLPVSICPPFNALFNDLPCLSVPTAVLSLVVTGKGEINESEVLNCPRKIARVGIFIVSNQGPP